MIKVILSGAAGKMGKALIRLIVKDKDLKLVAAIDAPGSPFIGEDVGNIAGINNVGISVDSSLQRYIPESHVVIDFSSTLSTPQLVKSEKPLVIGTTGHSKSEKEMIREASKNIPIVFSPNMSIGVNLLWKLSDIATKILDDKYAVSIVEKHHVNKKDSPSGTAKRMIEIVSKNRNYDPERDVSLNSEEKKPVKVQAIREGEIIGDHTLSLSGEEDVIELKHHAKTRDIFALGAIKAAKWIIDKEPGLYDMQDVLFE